MAAIRRGKRSGHFGICRDRAGTAAVFSGSQLSVCVARLSYYQPHAQYDRHYNSALGRVHAGVFPVLLPHEQLRHAAGCQRRGNRGRARRGGSARLAGPCCGKRKSCRSRVDASVDASAVRAGLCAAQSQLYPHRHHAARTDQGPVRKKRPCAPPRRMRRSTAGSLPG